MIQCSPVRRGRPCARRTPTARELLFNQFEEYRPGEDGYDIVTTIDSTIQYYVERSTCARRWRIRHPERRGGDRYGC